MDRAGTGDEVRALYESIAERALRYAARHVPPDQALDIAHDIASGIVRRRAAAPESFDETGSSNAFIHRAVINRLHNRRRDGARRATAEADWGAGWMDEVPLWTDPAGTLEARELEQLLQTLVAGMAPTMRRVFILLRDHGLTYKEVAAHLGVSVGTVHTHLSRANALIRRTVEQYRTGQDIVRTPS